CTPQALADALLPALRGDIDPALLAEYRRLHLELRHDASRSAATAIAELVDTPLAGAPARDTSHHA
ncbi:MAG: lipid-A-disaccharide synthase, partial [Dokdonella sp.]